MKCIRISDWLSLCIVGHNFFEFFVCFCFVFFFVQFSVCKLIIVSVNGDEGTPVPIPNTEVKLICADDT